MKMCNIVILTKNFRQRARGFLFPETEPTAKPTLRSSLSAPGSVGVATMSVSRVFSVGQSALV